MRHVTTLVGSLRRDSINLKLARAIAALSVDRMHFHFADLSALPMYNEDLWSSAPSSVEAFKAEVERSAAVFICTPEYNRSLPAVMKNAIDWGSRPYGRNSWANKPVAIAGASPGTIGAAVGLFHLRGVLNVLDARVMGQPEAYFSYKPDSIDDEHRFTDKAVHERFVQFVDRFDAWIGQG